MNAVSNLTIVGLWIGIAIIVALIVGSIFLHRLCYSKWNSHKWTLEEYFDSMWIIWFAVGCFLILCIFGFLIAQYIEIAHFHRVETIKYEEIIAEHDTLIDTITHSYDLVNTDLYSQIVQYNIKAKSIMTAYTNKEYSLWFRGTECDWGNLPLIVFKR